MRPHLSTVKVLEMAKQKVQSKTSSYIFLLYLALLQKVCNTKDKEEKDSSSTFLHLAIVSNCFDFLLFYAKTLEFARVLDGQCILHPLFCQKANPIKYVDPDGECIAITGLLILAACLLLQSDSFPTANPVNVDAINNKLANLYYDDPAKTTQLTLSSPYTSENAKTLTLKTNPVLALACALPTGNYSEDDYDNPNQMVGRPIENVRTGLDGLNLFGTIVENLSNGHVGDIKLTYKKSGGKITSWLMTLTTIDPSTGKSTGRQVFSKEDALKYLNDNKERLKNDKAYKELNILLD